MSARKPRRKIRKPPKQADIPAGSQRMRHAWIGLFLLGFLLYANTIGHDYTQDDAIVITENMYTQQGVQGIPGLLTKDTFFGFFKVEGKSRLVSGGRYRPLTPVMFAIEWELFGRNPWAGHLVNALLYGLTGVVLFYFLLWIGGRSGIAKHAWWFAVIGSALWLAHPLHTEAVANIKGRDEMMSLLLSLLAIYTLVRRIPRLGWQSVVLSTLLFFLALLSKENAVTFLAIVPLTLVLFAKESWRGALVRTLPLVGAVVLFLVIRGQVIGWEFGDTPRELMNNPFLKIENNRYVDFTTGEKLATIMYTLGRYVQLLFFPHPLTHDYYPRHVDIMQWSDWRVLLSALAYTGLVVLAITGWKKRKLMSFGVLFFLITLSIVSNIVFPVGTNMSERFMYMPSVGWAVALAGIATPLLSKSRNVVIAFLAAVVLILSVKTLIRNTVWKDNHTLFTTDIRTSANSAKLLVAAGGDLVTTSSDLPEGREKEQNLRQAIDYLNRAQQIHPNYKLSYLLKGNAYYYLGEWDQAIAAFRHVLRIAPGDAEGRRNLGVAYRDAGRFYGEQQGDLNTAISYLTQAVEYLPEDYETYHSLGVAYGLNGQSQQALEMFSKCVELSPENAMAHFNLGLAYQRVGDLENAQRHRDIAVQLDPEILRKRANPGNQ